MKKTIMLNAKLEIDSKYEITDEVITNILKGIDCWSDVHNIDNKLYKSTLINPYQYIPKTKRKYNSVIKILMMSGWI